MGLDGVEIIVRAEKAFAITIEDAEAGKISTPGQLVGLVLGKVGQSPDDACLTQRAFHRVRGVLIRRIRVPRERIRPDVSLKSLFPRSSRREDIQQVSDEIGLKTKINLVRPSCLTLSIAMGIFIGAVLIAVLAYGLRFEPQNPILKILLAPWPLIAAFLFAASFGWLSAIATRQMRLEFEPSITTVGDLSRWIVTNCPEVVKVNSSQWSREQVSETVREIVIDVLGCEKEYRENAHFVYDLGMS